MSILHRNLDIKKSRKDEKCDLIGQSEKLYGYAFSISLSRSKMYFMTFLSHIIRILQSSLCILLNSDIFVRDKLHSIDRTGYKKTRKEKINPATYWQQICWFVSCLTHIGVYLLTYASTTQYMCMHKPMYGYSMHVCSTHICSLISECYKKNSSYPSIISFLHNPRKI